MNYTYIDELYHFGIKGMKWGVRRFQNEDGSLTAAGRERYSSGEQTAHATVRALRAQRSSDYKKANLKYRDTMKRISKETQAGEEKIERNYKKGDTLSDEDLKKQSDLYRRQDEKALQAVNDYDHDRRDIKTSYKKQIKDVKNSPEYKAERNEKIKKAMIGAAVVGGVALAAYGAYKYNQSKSAYKLAIARGTAAANNMNAHEAMSDGYLSIALRADSHSTRANVLGEFGRHQKEAIRYKSEKNKAYEDAHDTAYYKLHTKRQKDYLDREARRQVRDYHYHASYKNDDDYQVRAYSQDKNPLIVTKDKKKPRR